jgi:four helix bundle protein
MQDYRKLRVWERAHQHTLAVYKSTRPFPEDERYGLTAQLRRSAYSVPANTAEGCGRFSQRDLARFLDIAMGSAKETGYHLLLARDLGYLHQPSYDALQEENEAICRMLMSLIRGYESNHY